MTGPVLTRGCTSPEGTFGLLSWKDRPLCVTLEDPWNGNQKEISCIPTGEYQCAPHSGPRFKDVWEVKDVPGRSAILIHSGNTIHDTRGCILVGLGIGVGHFLGLPGITASIAALNRLRAELPDTFTLTIR